MIFPRLVIVWLYYSFSWFEAIFLTWYWPLLGFLFMPHTLLWYIFVYVVYGDHWEWWQILILIVFISVDIGATGSQMSGGGTADESNEELNEESDEEEFYSSSED